MKQTVESLRQSEEPFRRAVVESPFPIMLYAEDGAILLISRSWSEITGYSQEELRTVEDWAERAGDGRKLPLWTPIEGLNGLEPVQHAGDFSLRTRSGTIRIWEFSSAPLGRLADGRRLVLTIAADVTERRRTESALQQALEKETALVLESHHRVKNHLSILASWISRQARQITHPDAQAAWSETRNRLESISRLNEMLHPSGRLDPVDIQSYLAELCLHLAQALGAAARGIALQARAPAWRMEIGQAVPLGLIVNELVFNALKHAFPDDRHGSVQVELTSEDEGFFTLRVKDDGVGLPAGLQVETENPPGTLGLKLVRLLVEQLQGSLQVRHEGGTVFKIVFPAGHLDTSFRK